MPYPYETVVDDILHRIARGEWREGDKLPPLAELEKSYPQSRMTLHKALRRLTDRGYLSMTRGRGTYVKAERPRPRIGILTGQQVFEHGAMPFALHVFRHAHAYFTRSSMDVQLHSEDPLSPTSLPAGLQEDLDRNRLAGLLTVAGKFPWKSMRDPAWRRKALPHVNIGEGPSPWSVDVDRSAFLGQALRIVRQSRRRRVALLVHESHLAEHGERFHSLCRDLRLTASPPPKSLPAPAHDYEQYGYELMRRVWDTEEKPDAVIVPDDVIAKGVAQAASTLGIKVPKRLLIVALVNRGAGFFYLTPIRSVEVNVEQLVATAVGMLIDQMNGVRVEPKRIMILPMAALARPDIRKLVPM